MGLRRAIEAWFFPKPLSVYRGVEVNRCRTDGQIVTPKSNLANHAGHYVVSPITLTFKEKALIRLGIIR